MSYDALHREYEAYKLKTKDWQSKVRERDIKMRQQLQRSTEELHEKDADLNQALSKLSQLEMVQSHALEIERALVEAKSALADAQSAMLSAQMDSAAAQRALRQMETDSDEKRVESLKLKERIEQLSEAVATLQYERDGKHVLFGPRGGSTAVKPSEVSVVLSVTTTSTEDIFGLVSNQRTGDSHWFPRSAIEASGLSLPKTVQEEAEQRRRNDIELATKALKNQLRSAYETELAQRLLEESKKGDAQQAAVKAELDETKGQVQELQTIISTLQEQLELAQDEKLRAVAAEREKAEAEVLAAVTAADKKWGAIEGKLLERVRELEEYKSRAQLAMKGNRTASVSEDREKVLAKELETMQQVLEANEEAAEKQRTETRQRYEQQLAELKMKLDQQVSLHHTDEVKWRAKWEAAELRAENAELSAREIVSTAQPVVAAKTVLAQRSVEVQCLLLNADSPRPIEPLPHRAAHAHARDEIDIGAAGNLEDSPFMHRPSSDDAPPLPRTLSSSGPSATDKAHGSTSTLVVEQLRRESRENQQSIRQLQEALKHISTREQHLRAEDAKLREQLSELERSTQREKDFKNNFDYAKNVLFKVLVCRDEHVRRLLIPVACEVLHLSPAERRELEGK